MSDASEPAPAPVKKPPMEIHKPRPVHNWREFLKEVGIIVLGVCIALAAEQAVQWWHCQGEVQAARQAIFAEMAANNSNLFSLRLAFIPCMDRQASEAEKILNDLEAGRPPDPLAVFHAGYGSPLLDSDWQSERSAGSLTHFPRAELALMGRYYSLYPRFDDWTVDERVAWRALAVLRHPPRQMDSGDLLRLRQALATARDAQSLIVLNAGRQLRLARQLGVPVRPVPPEAVEKFCTLDQEEYRKYLSRLNPYG